MSELEPDTSPQTMIFLFSCSFSHIDKLIWLEWRDTENGKSEKRIKKHSSRERDQANLMVQGGLRVLPEAHKQSEFGGGNSDKIPNAMIP